MKNIYLWKSISRNLKKMDNCLVSRHTSYPTLKKFSSGSPMNMILIFFAKQTSLVLLLLFNLIKYPKDLTTPTPCKA